MSVCERRMDVWEAGTGLSEKYLTFSLGDEIFGVTVLKIREIVDRPEVLPMPGLPESVHGMAEYKGDLIPVVDVHAKLGLQPRRDCGRRCMLVVNVEDGCHLATVGFIVDEVSELLHIDQSEIETTPSRCGQADSSAMASKARIGDAVVSLPDLDRLVQAREMGRLASMAI